MDKITRAQRVALKRVYDRAPIYLDTAVTARGAPVRTSDYRLTYRGFRRRAHQGFRSGCLVVFWKGMWLGIEPDGYTHS